jgi:serine protease Do
MKTWRQSAAVAFLSTAAVTAGFFGGAALFQHAEFARAEQQVETNREQINSAEDLSTVFRHVGKVIEPSVVNINVRKTVKHPNAPFNEDQLRKFFQMPGAPQAPDQPGDNGAPNGDDNADPGDNGPGTNGDQGDMEEIGTGSGVIMEAADGEGYILTNNHVAGDAEEMVITLADGRVIKGKDAKLVGADAKSDLAVVKIKADRLIPAKWGDSAQLEKGDWIMAFGSPFGYVGSMTHGIVSALDRHDVGLLGRQGYEDFIQVDAPINPGNSGGPLVNIHGEVVGINTAIASRSGGFQGIGFAIPSNEAKFVYGQLKDHGKVVRGWLGVSIYDVAQDPKLAANFGYTGQTGVLVEQTFDNTPASGKLQAGDIITRLNDQPVDNVQQLRDEVATTAPGTDVTLTVFRDHKEVPVVITIGNQPEDILASTSHPESNAGPAQGGNRTLKSLGLKLSTLTDDLAQKYGLTDIKAGALVTSVANNSLAANAGLRPGDVITRVGSDDVTSASDAADALGKLDPAKGIRLYVASQDGSRFVFIQPDTDQQ